MKTFLDIRVAISQQGGLGGRLEFCESIEIGPCSFTQLAEIMRQFDELAKKVKSLS